MRSGYSHAVITGNIADSVRSGIPRARAIADAYSHARMSFFGKHPQGAIPEWLAYPRGRRLREHYNSDGTPRATNSASGPGGRQLKSNPSPRADVQRAARRYTSFSGHMDVEVIPVSVARMPKAALAIGPVNEIHYSTVRDGVAENYKHRFARNSRPLLASSPDGKRLYLLGGAYNFGARGIVDKKRGR